MGDKWRLHEVSALIERGALIVGDGYRAKNEELSSHGLPFARAGNINDGFRFDDADHFPEENIGRVGNKVSQSGDVVFTSKGTVGRFGFVRPDTQLFVYSPQLCFWRSLDPELIDPRFLFFWIFGREFFVQFKGVAGQTDMAEYVSLTDQRRMHITLPPLPEQRAIAHILGTLDDKIELNRRMNETLEAMARALFKSWFADFDPVRAKAEGRQPARMDVETAALFPDSFIESELGLLPKGWDIKPVREIIEDLFDGPHTTPAEASEGAVYLGIKNLTGTQIDLTEIRYISELDWPQWTKRVVPRPHDIVFTYEATLGAFAIVPADLRCCLGRRLALVRPKTGQLDYCFLFHTFVSEAFQELLMARANQGSTVNRIPLTTFPRYPVIWPARQLIDRFHRLAEPLWSRIHQNQAEARNLFAIRDTLLPKLISGELRVKDAERFIGRTI